MDSAPLVAAIKAKDVAEARRVLAAEPALAAARMPDGASVLRLAIYVRASEIVEALLAAGARPDVYDAACLGDAARILELAEQDMSLVNRPAPDGVLPLHLAAHFGMVAAVKLLLELGADVHAVQGGFFANTALHAAAAGGQEACASLLLAAGARPDARDGKAYTALHIAAANGLTRLVELLLAHGASPRPIGEDGKSPRDFAVERGHSAVAALLAARGG